MSKIISSALNFKTKATMKSLEETLKAAGINYKKGFNTFYLCNARLSNVLCKITVVGNKLYLQNWSEIPEELDSGTIVIQPMLNKNYDFNTIDGCKDFILPLYALKKEDNHELTAFNESLGKKLLAEMRSYSILTPYLLNNDNSYKILFDFINQNSSFKYEEGKDLINTLCTITKEADLLSENLFQLDAVANENKQDLSSSYHLPYEKPQTNFYQIEGTNIYLELNSFKLDPTMKNVHVPYITVLKDPSTLCTFSLSDLYADKKVLSNSVSRFINLMFKQKDISSNVPFFSQINDFKLIPIRDLNKANPFFPIVYLDFYTTKAQDGKTKFTPMIYTENKIRLDEVNKFIDDYLMPKYDIPGLRFKTLLIANLLLNRTAQEINNYLKNPVVKYLVMPNTSALNKQNITDFITHLFSDDMKRDLIAFIEELYQDEAIARLTGSGIFAESYYGFDPSTNDLQTLSHMYPILQRSKQFRSSETKTLICSLLTYHPRIADIRRMDLTHLKETNANHWSSSELWNYFWNLKKEAENTKNKVVQ